MKKIKHTSIQHALQDGLKLHGFSSGGRLRVLSLDNNKDKQLYYGEGVDFHSALRILGDDVVAGGRKYKDVYGDGKIETAYWTGRYPTPGDVVDTWIYQGHGFDVIWENNQVVVKLVKKHIVRTPTAITLMVRKYGKNIKWKFVDYDTIYLSYIGDLGGCTTKVESDGSDGSDAWFKDIAIEGSGEDLWIAMTNAFSQTERQLEFKIL